jgi:hypothetical protein
MATVYDFEAAELFAAMMNKPEPETDLSPEDTEALQMPDPDYKALCAELLDALENAIGVIYGEDGTKHISTADAVITKADAALAQPEPEGPSDGEILSLMVKHNVAYLRDSKYDGPRYLRSRTEERQVFEVVRESLALYASPTIEPVGVTDEEIEREALKNADSDDEYRAFKSGAFFVQERISRPTIEDVPVAERLPGPEDCDAMGRCWWFTPRDGNPAPFRSADWSLYAGWRQKFTHWLPRHTLPVPGAEVG